MFIVSLIYNYVGSVQNVVSLLFASLCYFLITRLMFFNILFMLFCFVCLFSILCIISPFVHIAVPFLFMYKFTDRCHRVETELQ